MTTPDLPALGSFGWAPKLNAAITELADEITPSLSEGTQTWAAHHDFTAGVIDGGDNNLYLAAEAFTSGASLAADILSGYLAKTGTNVGTVAQSLMGIDTKPWRPSPALSAEIWQLANFQSGAGYNTSTASPSLTGNGSAQTSRTRVNLGNLSNQDQPLRMKLDVLSVPSSGWFTAGILITDSSGTALTQNELFVDHSDAGTDLLGTRIVEFIPPASGGIYLELNLQLFNNVPSGTLSVGNISLHEIAHIVRPLQYAQIVSVGLRVVTWHFDPTTNAWRPSFTSLDSDGSLTSALNGVDAAAVEQPFQHPVFDPYFALFMDKNNVTTGGVISGLRSMRVNNNDQILEVLGSDGTTYTLRGNTHGGESTTSQAFEVDLDGSGTTWTTWDGSGVRYKPCTRFRFTFNTSMVRPAPDSDQFATVAHVATWFPNGVMRMDRTTTFTKAVTLRSAFEWMSSHDTTVPKIGRIGRGLIVIDEVDTFTKVAAPATPTTATATSGGTLPAGTYSYAVTAVTEAGETTPSPTVAQVTTGSASTVTVSWTTVSGATGYRIYGRVGSRLAVLATVGPSATSYVDTGAAAAFGTPVPQVNTARLLGTASTANDAAISSAAYWGVWYDPIVGLCIANIYDRDSTLARPGVVAAKTRLEAAPGIMKSYLNLYWGSAGNHITANGETWSATHWSYVYAPQDPRNYHLEAALLASDLVALKANYPNV